MLLVDVGGTRTKWARLYTDDLQMGVFPTPSKKQFIDWVNRQSEEWALCLPGRWDHLRDVWERPSVWEQESVTADQIRNWFNEAPRYITNDLSAAAWGSGGSRNCLLISTGCGVRVLRKGQIVLQGSTPWRWDMLQEEWQGKPMPYWLSRREIQSWLPPHLQGLSWRQLGQDPPSEIIQAAQHFVDLLENPLMLGGGARALQPYLRRCSWDPFPEPALRGLLRGTQNQNSFVSIKEDD